MYHAIVRRRTVAMFERLSSGDWATVVDGLADDVQHSFPGDHALGGTRSTRASVVRWFERLGRLYPGHQFDVGRVVASGWPWDTCVAVEWTARLTPQKGTPYENKGTHWIRIRWGRATYFHAYLDTQLVERSCAEMAAAGVAEAKAAPIVD